MGKRASGEGTIYRRADGQWAAAVRYVDEAGRKKRRVVYGRTQAEVRRKLADARLRLDAGEPVKDATMSVAELLDDWTQKSLAASDRRQATKDLYVSMARTHLVPVLGRIPLDRLRPSDVEALIAAKRAQGLAPSTVRTIYTVLRAALDIAVRDGLVRRNVALAVRRPAAVRTDAAYLAREQAERLLEAIRGDRLEALYRLLLATGLRRGEALALHWADVDLDQATLRVRWTLVRTSRGLELGEPKTEKSRRIVPLPRTAVETLRMHRVAQATERLALGPAWTERGLVFPSEIGTPLDPRNVSARFQRVARRAGLEGVSLHTLRHSAASLLLAAGTHTKVVQEHLGHSSYAITADIYSHVAPAQAREAADRLDAAITW